LATFGGESVEMGQSFIIAIGLIGSLITIFFGIREFPKLWRWLKKKYAEWSCIGIIVIYVEASHNQDAGGTTLYLYLCGEESYGLFPSHHDDNYESYVLAMKQIHYDVSYPSDSDRYWAEWTAMFVKPLSEYSQTCLVKLIGECRFRFSLHNENDASKTVFDSFKYKTELKECFKKCEIEYDKKVANPQDRWKARDK
jgi:hypothetical protein